MKVNEIATRFNTHAVNPDQQRRIELVRARFLIFARELAEILPEGREESLVMTKLEEASFFAVAAIAREPKV